MTDPRKPLEQLLQVHQEACTDARERSTTEEILRFVRENAACAERSLATGHLTGSAWILDRAREKTLLTHHKKLGKWLQLGGHADGELDLAAVALREAREESGLACLTAAKSEIFDVDKHWIPAHGPDPGHWHYDLRFLIEGDSHEPLVTSAESKALAWVELAKVSSLNPEESLSRMVRKSKSHCL